MLILILIIGIFYDYWCLNEPNSCPLNQTKWKQVHQPITVRPLISAFYFLFGMLETRYLQKLIIRLLRKFVDDDSGTDEDGGAARYPVASRTIY